MTLGDRIHSRRLQLNMTQTALAAQVGRTATCVSRWESDVREPRLRDLVNLANSLETTVDWLIIGDRSGRLAGSKVAPRVACNDRGAGTGNEVRVQVHRTAERYPTGVSP